LELLTSEALELIAEDLEGAPRAIVTDAEALPAGGGARRCEGSVLRRAERDRGEDTDSRHLLHSLSPCGRTIRSVESARLDPAPDQVELVVGERGRRERHHRAFAGGEVAGELRDQEALVGGAGLHAHEAGSAGARVVRPDVAHPGPKR